MNRFGFSSVYSYRKNDGTYTVKNGDSLYSIAKKYKVSIEALMEANNLESTAIYPGQIIVIPVKVTNGGMYFEEYVIKPDDTLESIALSLNVPVDMITRYNDITRLVLGENQLLKIPYEYEKYTVQEGDTLSSILEKTGMTAEELIEANNKWLTVGNTINVK